MSRFLYHEPLATFLADVEAGRLVPALRERLAEIGSMGASRSEVDAWAASLPALANVLRTPELHASRIFVELFMPLDGRRCDALLTGADAAGVHSAVVIELKQWSGLTSSHLRDHVYVGGRNEVHPSIQVRDYCESLRHYHSAFTEAAGARIDLSGAAFLHNMPAGAAAQHLRDPAVFGDVTRDFPLFLANETRVFASWLVRRLSPGPGDHAADRIREGVPLPSPKLLDHIVETVKGTHEWRLLDVQKTAYFAIRHAVQVAKDTGRKRVIVIRGGPGTGKSVLAIQLLGDAARQHWRVTHATGSKAFQTVLQGKTLAFSEKMLKRIHGAQKKNALPVRDLFTTFAEVSKVGADRPDVFDLAVCDEAHRLWLHRRIKYPSGTIKWLSDTSMVEELIRASRVTAFFLDDNQSVRTGEIGRSVRLVEEARRLGVEVETFDLDAQFRCAGSESYIHWVEALFGLRANADFEWQEREAYDVKVWDSMPAMDAHLRALRAERWKCRMLAGYCWRWSKPDRKNGALPHDLQDARFDGWSGPWIEKTGKDLAPLDHQYFRWATLDEAYEQVGSIYSAQGFEFDHVGVIWGDDLVRRGDQWVAQLDRNKDGTFKKELVREQGDPVEKLVNIYRVLMTRGMRSTHLFVLDEETRAYVRGQLAMPARLRLAAGAERGADRAAPLTARAATERRAQAPRELRFVEPTPRTAFRECVPFIPLRAAAGGFSEEQLDLGDANSAHHWVTWDGASRFEPGMFVARVVGRSMEPEIADRAVCLFRRADAAQAEGKIALVRLHGDVDEATGGEFTVKRLHRLHAADEPSIVLRPSNPDFCEMTFSGDGRSRISVLAVVAEVLGNVVVS